MEELHHERRIRGNVRGSPPSQLRLQNLVNLGKAVPRNPRVEVMLEMKILVAHEEPDERPREDRPRPPDLVAGVLEKRVLAHPPDIDQRVDDQHRNEPAMQQPGSRHR